MTSLRSLVVCLCLGLAGTTQAQERYRLEIVVDGEVVSWAAVPPATAEAGLLVVPPGTERVQVSFAGGGLDLLPGDVDRFDFAHVVAVEFRPEGKDTFTVAATVRHRDEGWTHYADVWRVVAGEEVVGERILLHPHDEEQPFTRSQPGVAAFGQVRIEAGDTVHGFGGSAILLDLEAFPEGEAVVVRFHLVPGSR